MQNFYTRLRRYYLDVAGVLRGEASAASIFPNSSDIGEAREQIYAAFLRQHAPSKCNVFFGGFLFHKDGSESRQMDVIITTDTAPRFNFHNPNEAGKAFSPVEGTIGVASIKSTLDKKQLFDALDVISSIPPMESLEKRIPPILKIKNYDDWPYKIIYASNGINGQTILSHIQDFYIQHPDIPLNRRPHIIHVVGQYVLFRITDGMQIVSSSGQSIKNGMAGDFELFTKDPDLTAIVWVLDNLQQSAAASAEIIFGYSHIINRVLIK